MKEREKRALLPSKRAHSGHPVRHLRWDRPEITRHFQ